MDLSYTQNLEDYHLSLAFAGQATGTYIDVGAGHPVADNVSFWFYERGWSGVVVEPQPELAALYKQLRPRDRVVSQPIEYLVSVFAETGRNAPRFPGRCAEPVWSARNGH